MTTRLKSLRVSVAALLSLPIIPLCWIAFAGRAPASSQTACATTGASCMKCVADNCPALGYSQALYNNGTYEYTRCIDWDGAPPGHCSKVTSTQYILYDVYRQIAPVEVGSCYRTACSTGVIYADRACDNPLQL